jgi:hypothetical protein
VIALVTGPHRAAGFDLAEVDEPDPACNEAVATLRANSINRGASVTAIASANRIGRRPQPRSSDRVRGSGRNHGRLLIEQRRGRPHRRVTAPIASKKAESPN